MFEALSQIFSIIKGFVAAWERTICITPKIGLKIAFVNHKGEIGVVDIFNQIGKLSLIFRAVGQIPYQPKFKFTRPTLSVRLRHNATRDQESTDQAYECG